MRTRLFVILWVEGAVGVLSFLLVDLRAFLAAMPALPGVAIPQVAPALKLLSLIQPAVLVSLAVWGGVMLAPQVGLASPVAEAAAAKKPLGPVLQRQVAPGVLGGVAGGALVIGIWMLWKPFLPADFIAHSAEINALLPLPMRLLYGGFTEELLLRWGFMTLLVWGQWRVFQKRQGPPRARFVVGAILASAILFGLGHLPVALLLTHGTRLAVAGCVVVVNAVFGVIAGYLYWKKGLESAMLAHMFVHVVLVAAISVGV